MEASDTNWGKSVGAVVIHEGRVLLGRHTYGPGDGLLIIPGGYLEQGEFAEHAAVRETLEETGVTVAVDRLVGVRITAREWYLIFEASYVSGHAAPGDEENSEVVWLPCDEALARADVPELTKCAIRSVLSGHGLEPETYASAREPERSLYA